MWSTMRISNVLARQQIQPASLLSAALLAVASALVVALLASLVFALGVRLLYIDRALPGVSSGDLRLSGLSRAQIETALGERLTYGFAGRIVMRDGQQVWTAAPGELGVVIDIPTMADRALAVGRQGSIVERVEEQFKAWTNGRYVSPIVIFDQRAGLAYMERLALHIDRSTVEADLQVQGLEIAVRPGQIGRSLDRSASLQALIPAVSKMHDVDLPLVVIERPPSILDPSRDAEIARQILSQPLRLIAEGAEPLLVEPEQLAAWLQFHHVEDAGGARFESQLDPGALAALLEPLAPDLERRPENARFIFNDDTRQLDLLTEAVIGRQLNIPITIEAVQHGLVAGQHQIAMAFDTTDPAVKSDATAAELGITENVVTASTYFAGSSPERIQNIKTAAGVFHGLLVAPGETVSMAQELGDISLDNGYAEALIIFGGRTINGVGGGVCQVSTTLFRAAFFGGYPIVERYPHAYQVSYYTQGPNSPGAGLDATVFVPLVDFRFTNDTPYWLLMETYMYGTQLMWKFYSTSDGRTVRWNSELSNEVDPPEPLYKENEDLPRGELKKVDWAAKGLDVVVYRTVSRGGEVLHQDSIRTHYLPWREIWEYGPGTKLPDDAEIED
jgi:vancomycin resistance protein YoaR